MIVCNFSGGPVRDYDLQLPAGGRWDEVLNTDAPQFGGSGVGNLGVVEADASGRATLQLPPLGVLWLVQRR